VVPTWKKFEKRCLILFSSFLLSSFLSPLLPSLHVTSTRVLLSYHCSQLIQCVLQHSYRIISTLHPVHAVSNHDCDIKLVISNVFPSSKRRLSSSLGQAFVFIMPFVKQVMGELDLLPTPDNCFCHHIDPHASSSVQPASYLAIITINRS